MRSPLIQEKPPLIDTGEVPFEGHLGICPGLGLEKPQVDLSPVSRKLGPVKQGKGRQEPPLLG